MNQDKTQARSCEPAATPTSEGQENWLLDEARHFTRDTLQESGRDPEPLTAEQWRDAILSAVEERP